MMHVCNRTNLLNVFLAKCANSNSILLDVHRVSIEKKMEKRKKCFHVRII